MATSPQFSGRLFVQEESVWGVAPNSGGVATVSGADYVRHTEWTAKPAGTRITSSDRTGTKVKTRGAVGSRSGTYSLNQEIRPSGTAGTAPDIDPVLRALCGQAPTIVAGTSVTYNFHPTDLKSFCGYFFRSPSTISQELLLGGVVQQLAVQFEQQTNARWTFSGTGLAVPNSKTFSSLATIAKGGLTAFPSEPGSPTSSGSPVSSLAGSATIFGYTTPQIVSAALRVDTTIDTPSNRLFAGAYASGPEADVMSVFLDLTLIDEDTAALDDLRVKAETDVVGDISITLGSVAGQRVTFALKNCQLPDPQLDTSGRKWALTLQGIEAYATSASVADQLRIIFD